jgi:hypothetical protein
VRMVKRPRGADRRQRGGQRAARFACCSQGLSNPGCGTSDRGCGPIVAALRGVSPQPHGGRSHGLGRARNRRLDRRAAESPAQGQRVMSAFLPNLVKIDDYHIDSRSGYSQGSQRRRRPSLRALKARHGALPATLTAISPSGSLHHPHSSSFSTPNVTRARNSGGDYGFLGHLLLCCRPNDTQVLKVHRAAGFQSRLSEVGLMNVAAVSAHTAPGSANNLFGNGLFKPGFGLNG